MRGEQGAALTPTEGQTRTFEGSAGPIRVEEQSGTAFAETAGSAGDPAVQAEAEASPTVPPASAARAVPTGPQ